MKNETDPMISNLIQAYREALDFASGLDDQTYASPPLDGKWSPAQHLVHLIRSLGIVVWVSSWPYALQHQVLPNPALGKVTVREMTLFSTYHGRLHLGLIQRDLNTAKSNGS